MAELQSAAVIHHRQGEVHLHVLCQKKLSISKAKLCVSAHRIRGSFCEAAARQSYTLGWGSRKILDILTVVRRLETVSLVWMLPSSIPGFYSHVTFIYFCLLTWPFYCRLLINCLLKSTVNFTGWLQILILLEKYSSSFSKSWISNQDSLWSGFANHGFRMLILVSTDAVMGKRGAGEIWKPAACFDAPNHGYKIGKVTLSFGPPRTSPN